MPNDEYIKRGDALQTVEDYFRKKEKSSSLFMAVETMCLCLIHKTPAADVEPVRHGRWVKMTGMMPPEFTGHYQCSECGWFCKKHSIKETDFDFCPGCGAKMDGEPLKEDDDGA